MSVKESTAARLSGAASLFRFACPQCRQPLDHSNPGELSCPADNLSFQQIDGIWRMLTAERAGYFQTFISEYDAVRRAEGRGADDSEYYRALPFEDRSGRMIEDWRIRAKSFQILIERVVQPMEQRMQRPLKVLDVGAGNCWLSNRLSRRRHQVAAIDLRIDPFDGLGAHRHFESTFTPIQAEYDKLPIASAQFDLIIFNASIHYSMAYRATLEEALRVLRCDGHIAIIDTPVYHDQTSGKTMVQEREAWFLERFGFASNSIPSENYLTHDRLAVLASELGLLWRKHKPFYGTGRALRPWKAKIRRHREPASFLVIDGRRTPAAKQPTPRPGRKIGKRLVHWRYRLTQQHRYNTLVLEEVAGRSFVVLPQVFNPKLFRSGEFLAEILDEQLIPDGASVLDMGCGSGVVGITAARWASRVVSIDINTEAVRCTRINALLNRVEDNVKVLEGDLFAPVGGERFDVVLFNPPYFRGIPRNPKDRAWRSENTVERFAVELCEHLTPHGCALVVLSSDGDSQEFLHVFRANQFEVTVIARRELINETLTIYRLSTKE